MTRFILTTILGTVFAISTATSVYSQTSASKPGHPIRPNYTPMFVAQPNTAGFVRPQVLYFQPQIVPGGWNRIGIIQMPTLVAGGSPNRLGGGSLGSAGFGPGGGDTFGGLQGFTAGAYSSYGSSSATIGGQFGGTTYGIGPFVPLQNLNAFGANQFGVNQFGVNQFGLNQFGANQFGATQFGFNQFGTNQFGANQINPLGKGIGGSWSGL